MTIKPASLQHPALFSSSSTSQHQHQQQQQQQQHSPLSADSELDDLDFGQATISDGIMQIAGGIEKIVQQLQLQVKRPCTYTLHCQEFMASCARDLHTVKCNNPPAFTILTQSNSFVSASFEHMLAVQVYSLHAQSHVEHPDQNCVTKVSLLILNLSIWWTQLSCIATHGTDTQHM